MPAITVRGVTLLPPRTLPRPTLRSWYPLWPTTFPTLPPLGRLGHLGFVMVRGQAGGGIKQHGVFLLRGAGGTDGGASSSYDRRESPEMQAANNYIRNGYYAEAMNCSGRHCPH